MEGNDEDYNPESVRRILRSNRPRKWKRRAVMFYLLRTGYHSKLRCCRSWYVFVFDDAFHHARCIVFWFFSFFLFFQAMFTVAGVLHWNKWAYL